MQGNKGVEFMSFDEYGKNNEDITKYSNQYNEDDFFNKIKKYAKAIGFELLYKVFQLYYVLQKPDLPLKTKTIIMGALAYFILPIDVIPDFLPGIGYTDDLAVVGVALLEASTYIDDEVNKKAYERVKYILG